MYTLFVWLMNCLIVRIVLRSLKIIPIRAQKSNPIVTTGLLIYCIDPIVQALAPYLAAGCCAVNGLVPHALLIGWYHYTIIRSVCQLVRHSIYALFISSPRYSMPLHSQYILNVPSYPSG